MRSRAGGYSYSVRKQFFTNVGTRCQPINFCLFFFLLAVLTFVSSFISGNLIQIAFAVLVFAVFTMWGHVAVFRLFYANRDFISGFIWGCVGGIAVASLCISVLVFLIGWHIGAIFFFVSLLPALILLLLWKKQEKAFAIKAEYHQVVTVLIGAMIIAVCFFIFPFKNLGIFVDGKYVYAWLFGHDFINRMVHIESLSRGLPLKSLVFEGEFLSYYWLSYIFPALLNNLDFINLELKQLLQITQLLYSLLATGALVLFLKQYIHETKILIAAVGIAMCCYSYVWLLNTGMGVIAWLPDIYLPLSIDVSHITFSGFSHGLYRFFLVEPQGVLSVAIILMILKFYDQAAGIYTFILTGGLLGLLFGVEAVNGIILMLWFGGMSLYYFIGNGKARLHTGLKHVAAGSVALFMIAIMFSIEMYSLSTGQGALQLSPNWFALKANVAYFLIMYGPPFILGMPGLILLLRKREAYDHWVYGYVLLFAIGLFFAFFIQNPTEYHFGLLKVTRIIPIALLMLTVYFLQTHMKTKKTGIGVVLIIVAAFPSFVTDNMIASNVRNSVTFVRPADMDAAVWIRNNIPRDAVVQAEPNYPGVDKEGLWSHYAYSFIPIFAERATAIGEWKVSSQAHGRPQEVANRFHEIRYMFGTPDLDVCLRIINKYKIDYIYIGKLERELYSEGVKKFKENPDIFLEIFSTQDTAIYHIDYFYRDENPE